MTIPKIKRDELVQKFQHYFEQELETELGQFDGEFLLDFIIKQAGPVFYNQGLADAQRLLSEKHKILPMKYMKSKCQKAKYLS
jgi:uncharacterized protein (DUF2164 family)